MPRSPKQPRPRARKRAVDSLRLKPKVEVEDRSTMVEPHELLKLIACGDVLYEDVLVIRGKEVRVKRAPTLKERMFAAAQAAPYFAPKLAPKVLDPTTPDEKAAELRGFYEEAVAITEVGRVEDE